MRAIVPVTKSFRDFQVHLLKPSSGEKFNPYTAPWIEMRWTPIPLDEVTYELQIARNAIFSPLLSYRTKKGFLKIQIKDLGAYFWRVNAIKNDQSVLSENGTFTLTDRDPASVKKENVGPSILGFMMELAKDPAYKKIVKTAVIPSTECPKAGLPAGTYYCRLRPVSGGKDKEYRFSVP